MAVTRSLQVWNTITFYSAAPQASHFLSCGCVSVCVVATGTKLCFHHSLFLPCRSEKNKHTYIQNLSAVSLTELTVYMRVRLFVMHLPFLRCVPVGHYHNAKLQLLSR